MKALKLQIKGEKNDVQDFGFRNSKILYAKTLAGPNQNCTEQLVYFCEDVDCRDELQWKEADCYVI